MTNLHHLWQCVLAQALRDVFWVSRGKHGVDYGGHQDAVYWIGSPDFHAVCALAGLDGASVEARIMGRLDAQDRGEFDPRTVFLRLGGAALHRPRGQA